MTTNSNTLTVNSFSFIQIKPEASNIEDIMRFCGVAESDIEQEMIFHEGGDSYCVTGHISVFDIIGDYLVKDQNEIKIIKADAFETLLSPTKG